MKHKEIADLLNNREIGEEITEEEARICKENNLLVIFGYSDDSAILNGALNDQIYIGEEGEFEVCKNGEVPTWDNEYEEKKYKEAEKFFDSRKLPKIAIRYDWDKGEYSWIFDVNNSGFDSSKYSKFDILEDGIKYCQGLVIDISSIL